MRERTELPGVKSRQLKQQAINERIKPFITYYDCISKNYKKNSKKCRFHCPLSNGTPIKGQVD